MYVYVRIKMLSKKDLIEANKRFEGGVVVNDSSLDYAVKTQARSKNWLRAASVLTRAILVDHVFEDGNKRTAAAAIMALMELNKVPYDPEEVPRIIVRIVLKNLTHLRDIERCIKDNVNVLNKVIDLYPEVFEALLEFERTKKVPKLYRRKRLNITIDENILRDFKRYCGEKNINMSRLLEKKMLEEMSKD